jgi:hypothetical protein
MLHETAIAMSIPRATSPHVRRTTRERSQRRKLWLALIFLALRGGDALIYYGSPLTDKRQLLASLMVGGLWSTFALGGVWARKNWCRYGLNVILLCTTLFFLFQNREALKAPLDYRALAPVASAIGINVLVAWAMVSLPDIRRLAHRPYQ